MQTDDPDHFETRPAHRRVGIYLTGIFILGIAASMMAFLMSMQGAGWPAIVVGGTSQSPGTRTFGDNASVTLYASQNSKTYFTSVGGNYDALLRPWRDYLNTLKPRGAEIIDPVGIRALQTGVLIVPSAAALNADERQEILAFHGRGGSVLVTWATGTRGSAGEWTGWDFLDKLGGVKFIGEIPREAGLDHLVLNGESPTSITQTVGKSIWLGNTSERSLRLSGPAVGGQFLNSERIGEFDRANEGAIVFSETGSESGRVVVFGFAESSWEQQPAEIHALVTDAISWLKHKPSLVKAVWPHGRQAAHVVAMDVDQDFPNALLLAKMLKDAAIPGVFYALSSSALKHPDVLKSLQRDFEVGYLGDNNISFKGQPKEVQEQRIATMKSQLQTANPDGSVMDGFRAPQEGYDKTTEVAMLKAGIRHHLSGPREANVRLPFFAPIADTDIANGLIVLPRSQRNDLNLLASITSAPQLAQAMISDFNVAKSNGALAVLNVHSENFGNAQVVNAAMPEYLSFVHSQKDAVWLTSPREISGWWRDRERLQLSVRNLGPRIEFDLSVGGKQPVKGGSLTFVLPKKGALPVITGLKTGMPMPKLKLLDDFRATVIFESLEPGNYFYQATF